MGMTLGWSTSEKSSGGSLSKTSRAAARTLPELRALEQGLLVDDAAAGDVDDDDAVLHLGELGLAQDGLGLLGNVEGDEVGRGQELVEGDLLHGEVGLDRDDVVGEDGHAEGQGPLGDLGPDPAAADDAQGLAVELRALERLLLPLVRLHRQDGLPVVADGAEHEPEGVLGDGDGRGRRRVGHEDAFLLGRVAVDVVEPDAGPDEDLEVLARLR